MFASIPVGSSTSSVEVTSVRNGFQLTFDTSYSQRLAGIISPEEYQASIKRINDASKTVLGWVFGLIGGGLVILGFALFIYGATHAGFNGPPVTLFIGMGIFMGGGIFTGLSRHYVYKMLIQRMTDAIAYENTQYSSRQCSWRLHATPAAAIISNRGYVRTIYDYNIEIEIPRPETTAVMNFSVTNYAPQAMPPSYQQGYPPQPQPQYAPPAYMPTPAAHAAYQPPGVVNTYAQPYHPNQPMIPQYGTGSELSLCPGCQHKLKPEEKFCSQCGFRLNLV